MIKNGCYLFVFHDESVSFLAAGTLISLGMGEMSCNDLQCQEISLNTNSGTLAHMGNVENSEYAHTHIQFEPSYVTYKHWKIGSSNNGPKVAYSPANEN